MTFSKRLIRQFPAAALVASLLVLAPGPTGVAHAGKAFNTFASCRNSAPFKPATGHLCHYDKHNYLRATFVFRSHIGKKRVKACFRISGGDRLAGGACAKVGPLSYKAYPFKITGVTESFTVHFSWYVKSPGSKAPFRKIARSTLKVRP